MYATNMVLMFKTLVNASKAVWALSFDFRKLSYCALIGACVLIRTKMVILQR